MVLRVESTFWSLLFWNVSGREAAGSGEDRKYDDVKEKESKARKR